MPETEPAIADREARTLATMTDTIQSPSITIGAEIYSPNLGDGVIAGTLEHLIRSFLPSAVIERFDLSGRIAWASAGPDKPPIATVKRVRDGRLFRWYRVSRLMVWWLFARRPPGRLSAPPIDLFLIGGGQLLMDNELLFPVALDAALRRHSRRIRRIGFHACGVGDRWSHLGRRIMTRLLMDCRTVASSVRDEASRENIIRCLGLTADRVQIAHDPAFCAGDAYNIARAENAARIGLGIMAPLTSYPGTDPRICRLLSSERLQCFWQGIIASLDLAGHSVSLFTNGDEQDQAFAASIHRSLDSGLRSRVAIATKPARPEELVRMIAGFRAVLAQRLHSHIIAFSLGVPSVGIIWDSKVEEFAKLTDRRPFFLDPDQLTPAKATAQLAQAIAAGISTPHRLAIQAGVRKSVARLLVDAGLLEPTP